MRKNIIVEDDHMIVIFKPAGIATQTARLGQQDMVSELKNYLSKKPEYKGKGEPYLGLIHRLDQPVSGLLVFAKTREAAGVLSRQAADGTLQKYYYAVVSGRPEKEKERLENCLYKDGRTNQSMVVREGFPQAKRAALEYEWIRTMLILEENTEVSLVRIRLLTGRHHQIRVQMSYAGLPLIGDGKYGNEESKQLSKQINCKTVALAAYKLQFLHPDTGKTVIFEKQPQEEIFLPFFTSGI